MSNSHRGWNAKDAGEQRAASFPPQGVVEGGGWILVHAATERRRDPTILRRGGGQQRWHWASNTNGLRKMNSVVAGRFDMQRSFLI